MKSKLPRSPDEGSVPGAILAAYSLSGAGTVEIAGGLINRTFRIERDGECVAILQRLHPVFKAEVNRDIDAITAHLAARGMATPRLLRTHSGALWAEEAGETWRALTYVPGLTLHRMDGAERAAQAGALVGRFHRELADFEHSFAFARAGVHDTAKHLAELKVRLATPPADSQAAEALALGAAILAHAEALPTLPTLPTRICHGDLKVSNILFSEEDAGAVCLIDLDTLGHQSMAYEMGDALRSWGNRSGEDTDRPVLDLDICAAALAAYGAETAQTLSAEERLSIPAGLQVVCVELAARFCRDIFDDSYFGWDSDRFQSRVEHNLVRAKGQLALAQDVASKTSELRQRL